MAWSHWQEGPGMPKGGQGRTRSLSDPTHQRSKFGAQMGRSTESVHVRRPTGAYAGYPAVRVDRNGHPEPFGLVVRPNASAV
jgi:hypothetical protein